MYLSNTYKTKFLYNQIRKQCIQVAVYVIEKRSIIICGIRISGSH